MTFLRSKKDKNKLDFILNVKSIYIEISDSCNRRCAFCPNTDGSRQANFPTKRFPNDVYINILNQLSDIGYKNIFGFHLYNEPLLDYEYLSKKFSILSFLKSSKANLIFE